MHLFYIHSTITLLTSVSIVKHLNLKTEEVVFIFGRSYKFENVPYQTFWLGQYWKFEVIYSGGFFLLPFKRYREIRGFNNYVSKITSNKKYHLYIPHAGNYLMRLLISHDKCLSFNYIEEGRLTFMPDFMFNFGVKIHKNILKSILFTGFREYFKTKNNNPKLYVISKQIKELQQKIETVVVPKYFFSNINCSEYDNSWILVYDSFNFKDSKASDYIINTIREFLENNLSSKWLIKTHPHTSKEINKRILNVFDELNINYEILDNNKVMIEELIDKSKKLSLVGFYSSLLYYAALNGHDSHSLLYELKKSKIEELTNQFNFRISHGGLDADIINY